MKVAAKIIFEESTMSWIIVDNEQIINIDIDNQKCILSWESEKIVIHYHLGKPILFEESGELTEPILRSLSKPIQGFL